MIFTVRLDVKLAFQTLAFCQRKLRNYGKITPSVSQSVSQSVILSLLASAFFKEHLTFLSNCNMCFFLPLPSLAYPFKCKPVLFYDFDKMCSGTLFDESGMGNNGHLIGDISTFAGFNGDDGLYFKDGFIQLDGTAFKGKPTSDVTIAAWVKLKDINGPNIHELFATSAPAAKNPKKGQYHFEVLDQGKVRFFQRNNGKIVYGLTTKPVVQADTWVHLAGTYDSSTNKAAVFVNGEPVVDYLQSDTQVSLQQPSQRY